MSFTISAACGCSIGRIRENNEDNFYFDGKCLEAENEGMRNIVSFEDRLKAGLCLAVFDGIGGESGGELASFTAARELQSAEREVSDYLTSERKHLEYLTQRMNCAVVSAADRCGALTMGTTAAVLYFGSCCVYSCNVGDSRAYRLRSGEFMQLTRDHTEGHLPRGSGKAALTQYLGIDPAEMRIEPYIAKGELRKGDVYLLCSDGLTDMVSNVEISGILLDCPEVEQCARRLLRAALEHGGRDNVTVIVCRIS